MKNLPLKLAVLLYDGFELLDVFGPLEVFGQCDNQFEISLVAESEIVQAYQGQKLITDYKLDHSQERKRRYLGRYFALPWCIAKRDDYNASAVPVTRRSVP